MTSPDQGSGSAYQKQRELEKRAMPIWQVRALREGSIRSCCNCEQFNRQTELCLIAGDQRPPALVIALGCDSWEQEIPF